LSIAAMLKETLKIVSEVFTQKVNT